MPEFILDTSGEVARPAGYTGFGVDRPLVWRDLDSFTQGYIEALFFTENEPAITRDEVAADPEKHAKRAAAGYRKEIPGDYGFLDLAPETLLLILETCRGFQNATGEIMDDFSLEQLEQAGRDFWYTRNGHGVGFWDRDDDTYGTPALRDALNLLCKGWSAVDAYLGEDGKVYLS